MQYSILIILLLLPFISFAQYTPIVNLPIPTGDQGNFQDYVNAIYALSISIAALLAVIKIVIAGVKWMTTDIIPAKGEAKKDIQGALVGLLLIIAAVIIINIINPNIAQVNFALNTIEVREIPSESQNESEEDPLIQYCEENEGQCSSESCSKLATDYLITWIVNDPLNRLQCSLFCSGIIIGRDTFNEGHCLYANNEEAFELDTLSNIDEFSCINLGRAEFDCDRGCNKCKETGRTCGDEKFINNGADKVITCN